MTALAIFGGSFNPPHVAHQLACLWVLETQPVDALLVVPTFRHPFEKALAPFADRVEMCRLMAAPLGGRVEVSTIEAELGGESSRSLYMLEALAARRPGARLRLVIGADILAETPKWHRWADVAALAPPIVLGRAGFPGGELALADVSSTEVRARLASGRPIDGLVPTSVRTYLEAKGLYRTP
jgi:nicotinate-nucleotide adenylyltransferase